MSAGTVPGQETTNGTLTPPSNKLYLVPCRGVLSP